MSFSNCLPMLGVASPISTCCSCSNRQHSFLSLPLLRSPRLISLVTSYSGCWHSSAHIEIRPRTWRPRNRGSRILSPPVCPQQLSWAVLRHTVNRQTYRTEFLRIQRDVRYGGNNSFSVPQFNTTLHETNRRLA